MSHALFQSFSLGSPVPGSQSACLGWLVVNTSSKGLVEQFNNWFVGKANCKYRNELWVGKLSHRPFLHLLCGLYNSNAAFTISQTSKIGKNEIVHRPSQGEL
jgi:hypothetical protein